MILHQCNDVMTALMCISKEKKVGSELGASVSKILFVTCATNLSFNADSCTRRCNIFHRSKKKHQNNQ